MLNGFPDPVPKPDEFKCEKIGRRGTVKTNTRDVDSITWVIFFKLLTNRTFSKNGIGYAD